MMTPAEIIEEINRSKSSGHNEAETRIRLINSVLFDVLGWTHADVHHEERVSEDGVVTWADYVIRTGMTAIVIEAKKVVVELSEVPVVRRARLRGRFVSGETGAAIIQARDYARKLGVPFACVTNGDKWIIFPAARTDQVSFSDSSAVIFPSAKSALEEDFAEFYDLLARSSVIKGRLEGELLGRIENQIEDRRLNRFFTTSFSKISRHSLFPLIEDAITTAFSEDIVSTNKEILEKCYVQTPERVRFDSRIGMHIARRASVVGRSSAHALKSDGRSIIKDLVVDAAARTRSIAVLILGPVGAGKTTFLEYTRAVSAERELTPDPSRPYPHWMRVDFKPFTRGESAIQFILDKIKLFISSDPFLSDYERCIKHAYKEEIESLFRGPLFLLSQNSAERNVRISDLLMSEYKSTRPYVEKIMRYAASKSPVFVVIDNVDQVERDQDQSAVFADAMAFAQTTGVNLICAMREATFVINRNNPLFDAFDFDPVVIDPPDIKAVLSKRFFVARQLLEGKSGSFIAENGAEVNVKSLSTIIELVQSSVLGTEIGNLIEVLATSDIRLALRMTREFLHSGWTASGKALRLYESSGRYVMPQHEALRAIMLGNRPVYFEEFSVIGNPFDARLSKTEAQLVRLYVLNAIVLMSASRAFRYLEGSEIQRCLREIGFGDNVALKILEDLCRMRFIHTVAHTPPSLEANFIVSRLGGYIIRHFIGDMTFLENVMVDTFIADSVVWDDLRRITSDIYAERDILRKMSHRKKRVLRFFGHMKELYEPLRTESLRRGLPNEWCGNPLDAIEQEFLRRLNRAMSSAERNYGPNAQAS